MVKERERPDGSTYLSGSDVEREQAHLQRLHDKHTARDGAGAPVSEDYRTNESVSTLEALHASLRGWAKGDLGYMAAVEFLLGCPDVVYVGCPLTPYDPDGRRHWVDFDQMDHVDMSGGTYATWSLARSIYDGVISQQAWRLDGQRRAAFVRALAGGLGVSLV